MKILKFTLITVLFIWLSHYAAAFPHEYAHSIMAWLLGFKQHALGIDYGGKSISNILTIKNINENNNYYLIYLLGGQHAIGWIAFAGPGIGNGGLYVLSLLCLLKSNTVKRSPYLYYFLFWFNLMCLGNLYSYVPLRTFTTHGDVGHMLFALSNPSPWWIFIPVGYVVMFLVYYFFSNTLPK
nr:hypothetical protein [Gammaproteobacteria bacterium]